jgi:hypothetical protein
MSEDPLTFVTLRTGREVLRITLLTTHIALDHIVRTDGLAAFEAVQLARDPNHRLWNPSRATLEGFGLLDDAGALPESVAAIIDAAFIGGTTMLRLLPIEQVLAPVENDGASAAAPSGEGKDGEP